MLLKTGSMTTTTTAAATVATAAEAFVTTTTTTTTTATTTAKTPTATCTTTTTTSTTTAITINTRAATCFEVLNTLITKFVFTPTGTHAVVPAVPIQRVSRNVVRGIKGLPTRRQAIDERRDAAVGESHFRAVDLSTSVCL